MPNIRGAACCEHRPRGDRPSSQGPVAAGTVSAYRLQIKPPDVRAFIGHLDEVGLRATNIRSILAPVKAMYATAVEDGAVRANPTVNVRIGIGRKDEPLERRFGCRVQF